MKQLSKKEILSIVEMRNNGMTNNEIAKKYNVSVNSIVRWAGILRKAGYEVKRYPRGGRTPKIKI